jgi:hypothetical protein
VFGVLACGPRLTWNNSPPLCGAAIIALGGLPGNGFDLPHDMSQLISYTRTAASDASVLRRPSYGVSLPFSWLSQSVPLLKPFRVPARLATGVLLCSAVLAAFGLKALQDRMGGRFNTVITKSVIFCIGSAMLFEACPYPYPIGLVKAHPFFERIAKEKENFSLIEAPIVVHQELMHLQTVHGKPIYIGHLARAPRQAFWLPATNKILRFLSPQPFIWQSPEEKPPPQTWEAALRQLRKLKTRYIIIHKGEAKPELLRQYDQLLMGKLKLPVIYDDAELRVYRL